MTRKRLIIFGDRTAAEMLTVAQEICADQFESIETHFVSHQPQELELFCQSQQTDDYDNHFLIGVINLELRRRIELICMQYQFDPWTLVHPTAYVAPSAKIGKGCFIAPLVAIGIESHIEDHCIVHFGASVGHDARLGSHCCILPGARISGQVTIGEGVLIGSNAFLYQGISVGENVKIDALTYVRENVAPRRIVSVRRPS